MSVETKGSYILTKELAKIAVWMVEPSIDKCLNRQGDLAPEPLFKRNHLAVVILNPSVQFMGNFLQEDSPVLYRQYFGIKADWENPYGGIAQSKALNSLRTGLSTRDIAFNAPWLLQNGDTPYYGSVVRNGLIVAVSGVQPWYDEMVAGWVADACIALCHNKISKILAEKKVNYLGED